MCRWRAAILPIHVFLPHRGFVALRCSVRLPAGLGADRGAIFIYRIAALALFCASPGCPWAGGWCMWSFVWIAMVAAKNERPIRPRGRLQRRPRWRVRGSQSYAFPHSRYFAYSIFGVYVLYFLYCTYIVPTGSIFTIYLFCLLSITPIITNYFPILSIGAIRPFLHPSKCARPP